MLVAQARHRALTRLRVAEAAEAALILSQAGRHRPAEEQELTQTEQQQQAQPIKAAAAAEAATFLVAAEAA